MAQLDVVKMALRITTNAYDNELNSLIASAELDLGVAGVEYSTSDELISTAIVTYCKMHFGKPTDMEYKNLKTSYDEQKAQLSMCTGYTDWSGADE